MMRGAMRSDRWPSLLPLVVLLAAGLAAGSARARAGAPPLQDAPSASEAAAETEPAPDDAVVDDESSVAEQTPYEFSDAERLLRMQQVVTSDEAKLERLRTDLASRQAFLDMLTGQMATFQTTWDEMQARLEGLEAGSEDAASLREEIQRLEDQYGRFNRHASLTLEAEGALRKQIRSLEGKIRDRSPGPRAVPTPGRPADRAGGGVCVPRPHRP